MVTFKARVLSKQLQDGLRRYPVEAAKRAKTAMRQHGLVFEREMNKRFGATLVGPWKTNPSGRLASRTGKLRRSVGTTVTGTSLRSLRMRATVGGNNIPARIHEDGGVIRGRPWLKIPGPDNLTPAGVVRFNRRLPGSFIIKSKKGNLLVVRKGSGGGGSLEILWLLKREVRIKPRLQFVPTFERVIPKFLTRLSAALKRAKKDSLGRRA